MLQNVFSPAACVIGTGERELASFPETPPMFVRLKEVQGTNYFTPFQDQGRWNYQLLICTDTTFLKLVPSTYVGLKLPSTPSNAALGCGLWALQSNTCGRDQDREAWTGWQRPLPTSQPTAL